MQLFNSFSQTKELLTFPQKDPLTLYVCGITPYDTTHLGHAFTYMFFDVFVRFLRYQKYHVTYLQNVTDIDDDILHKAKEGNTEWQTLGTTWTNRYLKDMEHIHIAAPTYFAKATESIPTIITMVQKLIKTKFAYVASGNVYFDIKQFPRYGQLSHYSEKQMILLSKERGADPTDTRKRHPLDFILWVQSKKDEPYWEAPFSKGRPGWHIECSAMIRQYLGEQITFHGGGHDLIFPHHESEIAQSESYTHTSPFVTFWLHTAMVMYQGEKMSKSLGNLVLIADLLKHFDADTIRYVLLSHHYRSPWDFDMTELTVAEEKMTLLKKYATKQETKKDIKNNEFAQILDALKDDMQTPTALQLLDQVAKRLEKGEQTSSLFATLNNGLNLLGFNQS